MDYAAFAENHRFQIPTGAHWKDVRADAEERRAGASRTPCAPSRRPTRIGSYGIFGDAPWTNKERLPDETLHDLIEHFSSQTLSVANVPEDELGNAYEYLIKKFADDSGHTAAEFYTNRTVVHLMTQMLDPQPGESIYDPTCGTGGMLISAVERGQAQGGEYRTLKLYGQERNLMTSAIARMNLFLHGVRGFPRSSAATRWPTRSSSRATACASSTWCWPTRRTRSSSGTARPGRPTRRAATSRRAAAGPRRLRLLPAHPHQPASRRPAAARSSSRTACCSATKSGPCARSWSSTTWWSA